MMHSIGASAADAQSPRVALIGFGATGRILATMLRGRADIRVGIVLRSGAPFDRNVEAQRLGEVLLGPAGLASFNPTLVVECAGHEALAEYGPAVLYAGRRLIAASSGALADPVLEKALRNAAARGGGSLEIVAGAVAGLDALAAIPKKQLSKVFYEGVKRPEAWRNTPAEAEFDLSKLDCETPVFSGTARQAASRFPKNANVVATVALAGLGFDRTSATLVASPGASGNTHRIRASGAFGTLSVEIAAAPLRQNPKTSSMTPVSLFRAVCNQLSGFAL